MLDDLPIRKQCCLDQSACLKRLFLSDPTDSSSKVKCHKRQNLLRVFVYVEKCQTQSEAAWAIFRSDVIRQGREWRSAREALGERYRVRALLRREIHYRLHQEQFTLLVGALRDV